MQFGDSILHRANDPSKSVLPPRPLGPRFLVGADRAVSYFAAATFVPGIGVKYSM